MSGQSASKESPPRSNKFVRFDLQVTGNGDIVRSSKGHLLKLSNDKERFFYDTICNSPTSYRQLRSFIPRYYGTLLVQQNGEDTNFLKLQDLTAKMTRPCILDVKLGARHWGDDTSGEVIHGLRSRAAATTSVGYGIRFSGMRRETPDGRIEVTDCDTETVLTATDLLPALRWFLYDGKTVHVSVAQKAARAICALITLMEKQTKFLFHGSSLLVLYDGAVAVDNGDQMTTVRVKLIDFAHISNAHGQTDGNTLFGLRYLLELFEEITEKDGSAHLPEKRC